MNKWRLENKNYSNSKKQQFFLFVARATICVKNVSHVAFYCNFAGFRIVAGDDVHRHRIAFIPMQYNLRNFDWIYICYFHLLFSLISLMNSIINAILMIFSHANLPGLSMLRRAMANAYTLKKRSKNCCNGIQFNG